MLSSKSLKSTFFSKHLLSLLCGAMLASITVLEGSPVAIPLGLPERISPIPGPANPDPILQNLQAVMDNFYIQPWYPGLTPYPENYLGGIYYLSNYYLVSNLVINPVDDRIMNVNFGQNMIADLTGVYRPTIGSNTFATSFNQGLSWNYGPPILQIIPLGGTISQLINSSLGPGLHLYYDKHGKLYASGQGFDDLRPNPPYEVPRTGFLYTTSEDNGKTWRYPTILTNKYPKLPSDVDWWFTDATGLGWADFYTLADPANSSLIHGNTTAGIFQPGNIAELMPWGDVYYTRSEDGGKTFSSFRNIYSMWDDPVWQAKYFDPDFTSDPNYFIYGGWSLHGAPPLIVDQNVLIMQIQRYYPAPGATTYTGSNADTYNDFAAVRSLDNGKTWNKVAGATEPCLDSGVTDPGYVDPFEGLISEAGNNQSASPVISPFTGRIYFTVGAGNPAAPQDLVSFCNYAAVSASSDQGETWTPFVKANRTPTDISFGAQQAFDMTAIMTLDGSFVVAYYDFRYWTGFPGEDIQTTPLPTDAWIAVYKEVDDPRGGSTGIGLDFVEEIRLTSQSFNARFASQVPPYFATGTPEGIKLAVNSKNELFVLYSTTNEGSPSNITTGYLGLTIDTNSYFNILQQRFQFPMPSNQ